MRPSEVWRIFELAIFEDLSDARCLPRVAIVGVDRHGPLRGVELLAGGCRANASAFVEPAFWTDWAQRNTWK